MTNPADPPPTDPLSADSGLASSGPATSCATQPGGKALSREERLAARLRDNLRRRKEQSRGQIRGSEPLGAPALPKAGPKS